jgi:hypothetical protein
MEEDYPMKSRRDSAFFFKIDDINDKTPVRDLFTIDKDLCAMTDKGIYILKHADEIDPERTNVHVPNSQKKILSRGLEDEIVGRILLTGRKLFNKKVVATALNCDTALSITFKVTKLLIEMQDIEAQLTTKINNIVGNGLKIGEDKAVHLPNISNLSTQIDNFIRKADQIRDNIITYLKLAYDSGHGKKTLQNLYSDIVNKSGKSSGLAQFLNDRMQSLVFIRNLRNGLEHPKEDDQTIILDFRMESDGAVHLPSIELINKDTQQPRMQITTFVKQINTYLLETVESLIVHICLNNIAKSNLEISISELPVETRLHTNTRFSYVTKLKDDWVPFT